MSLFTPYLNLENLYTVFLKTNSNSKNKANSFLEKELSKFKILSNSSYINLDTKRGYCTSIVFDGKEKYSNLVKSDDLTSQALNSIFKLNDIIIEKSSKCSLASMYALQDFMSNAKNTNDPRILEIVSYINDSMPGLNIVHLNFISVLNNEKQFQAQSLEDLEKELIDLIKTPDLPISVIVNILKHCFDGLSPGLNPELRVICAKAIEHIDFKALSPAFFLNSILPGQPHDYEGPEEYCFSVMEFLEKSIFSLTNSVTESHGNYIRDFFVSNFYLSNDSFSAPYDRLTITTESDRLLKKEKAQNSLVGRLNKNFTSKDKVIRVSSFIAYAAIFVPLFISSQLSFSKIAKASIPKLNSLLTLYGLAPNLISKNVLSSLPPTKSNCPYTALEILGNHILYKNKHLFSTEFQKKIIDIAIFNSSSLLFQKARELKNYTLSDELQAHIDKRALSQEISFIKSPTSFEILNKENKAKNKI